jgi:hypothetical protein
MWKRCRYWFLLIALIGIGLAAYFEPTRCVRGWLWGEAFFDGRPTSYWRGRVDRWLRDRGTVDVALSVIPTSHVQDENGCHLFSGMDFIQMNVPPTTWWGKMWAFVEGDDHSEWNLPKVLFAGEEAEPVLRELVTEPRFRKVVQKALNMRHEKRINIEIGK